MIGRLFYLYCPAKLNAVWHTLCHERRGSPFCVTKEFTVFPMLTRISCLVCTLLICLSGHNVSAQTSVHEFQRLLSDKVGFDAIDFVTLKRQQTVVKLGPVSDKREVAVVGVVNIRAGADEFLQSYRDGMTRRNNAAILEIGSFPKDPVLSDLQNLTVEAKDIEDLKECVVGDCQIKLSASMIERFRNEINWQASDYSINATSLYKQMLLDYVRDYRARGEQALIAYNDKRNEIALATEQSTLDASSSYINDVLAEQQAELNLIEDAIVWSKIKFGLKPVIAVNHIKIYRREREAGPQVIVASKQIYANHYFNASLALTAFVTVPDATQSSYLVYENRSRADGLEGPFSKIKRTVVEKKALEGLKAILEHSKASLDGTPASARAAEAPMQQAPGWGHRLFGGIRPLLWILVLSALLGLLLLGRNGTGRKSKSLKPESAKS